jgi:hypothetical protein
VLLILDAEKTIGGEGMISLLRIILFATRNYTAVFQGTYKGVKKKLQKVGATTSLKNSCCISVLLAHSVGPARRETSV